MNFQAMTRRVADRYAADTITMIAAVSAGQLLGAQDAINRKYLDPARWSAAKRGVLFELMLLRRVPFDLAERLADVGTPASDFPNSRAAWATAKRYADPNPFAVSP